MSDTDAGGADDAGLVPLPAKGRTFTREREVRLGDAAPSGRLRLDALARYLQDVANDDAREAIGSDADAWVVRRTVVEMGAWPRLAERVTLTTFCGGAGPRWAERRTSVRGDHGAAVEAASLWVPIDVTSGRPVRLPERFLEMYGDACGERRVSGRLSHPAPPDGAHRRPWALRRTDFDVMGHVNNAVYWAVVEEVLDGVLGEVDAAAVRRVELEYRTPVEPHADGDVWLVSSGEHCWLAGAAGVHASARVVSLRR